jgi:hypothetical protein
MNGAMTIEEVKKLSLAEVKALAYDTLARLENEKNSLQVLNQIIAEKSKVVEPVKE